jgi:histidyl-tRNA synthetase
MAFGDRGLKGSMKSADKLAAKCVVVIGDGELDSKIVNIKRMADGKTVESSFEELDSNIKKLIEEK